MVVAIVDVPVLVILDVVVEDVVVVGSTSGALTQYECPRVKPLQSSFRDGFCTD